MVQQFFELKKKNKERVHELSTSTKKTTHDPTFHGGWELREENVDEIPCETRDFLSFLLVFPFNTLPTFNH